MRTKRRAFVLGLAVFGIALFLCLPFFLTKTVYGQGEDHKYIYGDNANGKSVITEQDENGNVVTTFILAESSPNLESVLYNSGGPSIAVNACANTGEGILDGSTIITIEGSYNGPLCPEEGKGAITVELFAGNLQTVVESGSVTFIFKASQNNSATTLEDKTVSYDTNSNLPNGNVITMQWASVDPGEYTVTVLANDIQIAEGTARVFADQNTKLELNADLNTALSRSTADPEIPQCENNAGAFGWIFCEALRLGLKSIGYLSALMGDFLKTRPLVASDSNPTYVAWKNLRNLSLGLIVLVMLIAIVMQATPIGLDAYTIKKIVPRTVFASIGMVLSFFVVAFLIDIFNVVGGSLYSFLLGSVTNNLSIPINAGATVAGSLAGALAVGSAVWLVFNPATIVTIILVIIPVLLAFLTAAVVLLARHVIIMALVIVSPLAFAAWILPNTEAYFKRWWSLLLTMLFMYPLVMLLLAAGSIFAVMIINGAY